jgi:drug/metabolite transporter (DMT)-like permease
VTSVTPSRISAMDSFAVLIMIFLTLVWGVNTVVGKIAIGGVDPIFLSFLRAVLAGAAVLGWCWIRGIAVFKSDGSLKSGMVVGLLFGVEFALIYVGLDLTSASRANLMVNTMPLFALLGSHFLLGERATSLKIAGTLLSFVGVAIVFFDKLSLPSPQAIYGDLLCIGGGAAWAATALVIRRTKVGDVAPEKLLLYQLAGAGLVALPLLPFSEGLIREMSMTIVAAILFQAFFVVAFTYSVWFWVMTRYPLTGLSAFTFLTPVFGVAFSGFMLDEPITAGLLGGLFLIVIGLMMVNGNFSRRMK